jgi:hypothetical protein
MPPSPMRIPGLLELLDDLLRRAETATAEEWRLTGADLFLMTRLASTFGLTLPATTIQSSVATFRFLKLGRSALVEGRGHSLPEWQA